MASPASSDEIVLGIDFGTTYSAAAALVNGRLEMVLDQGDAAIPSMVYVPRRGDPQVGQRAVNRMLTEPGSVVRSVKRVLGRPFEDSAIRVFSAGVPYAVRPGPQNTVVFEINRQELAAEQLASYMFGHIRRLAEARFGPRSFRAVVGMPVRCPPGYKKAIRRAARIAGIEVVEMVPEPVAGARALGLRDSPEPELVSVVDFGGGTLDVSVLHHKNGQLLPLATGGDEMLGGDDFDQAIAEGVAGAVFQRSQFDIHRDTERWQRLLSRAEAVKCSLSFHDEAPFRLRDAYVDGGQRCDIDTVVDRPWADGRWAPLLSRAAEIALRVSAPIRSQSGASSRVFLLGGTSMIPAVQRVMRERLGDNVHVHERSDLAVVVGLAMYASRYARSSREAAAVYR